jgi:hypothetical protein
MIQAMFSSVISSQCRGTPSGTITGSTPVAGTKAPYVQFLVCIKL